MHEIPVAVKTATGGYTAVGAVGTFLVSLIGLVVAWVRFGPKWKEVDNNREANLLQERADDMHEMRDRVAKLERRAEIKDILHEAERSYDRHRINNLAMALNAFFLMVKANPDDAAKAAAMIEEMRQRQLEDEKKEQLALRELAARLTAEKV